MARSVRFPAIGFFLGLFGGLFVVWRGLYLLRGGTIGEQSLEYSQVLTRLNIARVALKKPRVQRLTPEHLRLLGAVYLAAGLLMLGLIALGNIGGSF